MNIVLVVLDTTRADHTSAYGYALRTTPNLERLAKEAIVFERAYANSPWTLSSHASLFTGLLPLTHQATQENLYLDDELDTLAELLGADGYTSAAFTNNSWISRVTNLVQGFDEVFPMWRERHPTADAGLPHPTNVRVLEWLAERDPAQPFFLFVNFIEPHAPYAAPREFQDAFVDSRASQRARRRGDFTDIQWYAGRRSHSDRVLRLRSELYDSEIAYVDAVLGELVEGLRERGLLERSLLVVTSDHGENLGERGHIGHNFTLYDSTQRVPLILRLPDGGEAGSRRTDAVQLSDLFVTLAEVAGVEPRDARVTGRDLLAGPTPPERAIVGEYYHPKMFMTHFPDRPKVRTKLAPFDRRLRSIQVGTDKLIWGSDGQHELYDLARDPGETLNRIAADPETAKRLEAQLGALVERLERPIEARKSPPLMDDEMRAELRALGYLP